MAERHALICLFPYTVERMREVAGVLHQPADACWEWPGPYSKKGYGRAIDHRVNRRLQAHRLAYEFVHGPTDLLVCHECDNPPCFNPSHLFAGTNSDNLQDMSRKGRGPWDRQTWRDNQRAARLAKSVS